MFVGRKRKTAGEFDYLESPRPRHVQVRARTCGQIPRLIAVSVSTAVGFTVGVQVGGGVPMSSFSSCLIFCLALSHHLLALVKPSVVLTCADQLSRLHKSLCI